MLDIQGAIHHLLQGSNDQVVFSLSFVIYF